MNAKTKKKKQNPIISAAEAALVLGHLHHSVIRRAVAAGALTACPAPAGKRGLHVLRDDVEWLRDFPQMRFCVAPETGLGETMSTKSKSAWFVFSTTRKSARGSVFNHEESARMAQWHLEAALNSFGQAHVVTASLDLPPGVPPEDVKFVLVRPLDRTAKAFLTFDEGSKELDASSRLMCEWAGTFRPVEQAKP